MNPNGLLKPLRRTFRALARGTSSTAASEARPAPLEAREAKSAYPAERLREAQTTPPSRPSAHARPEQHSRETQTAQAAPGPVVLQHTWAAEPNALKLQANRMLLPLGTQRRYATATEAAESPLAQAVFALGGIASVELDSAFVTVLMEDDADWDALMAKVPDAIKAHLEAGKAVVTGPVATGLDPAAPAAERVSRGADSKAATGGRYQFGFQHVTRTPEEQYKLVQELFDSEINPAVAQHGGHFALLEVKENRVFVELSGGCQGCGMADVTLRQGVEQRLKEVMPEMAALIDVTDHSQGENPYYRPSK
jgi:Fe-S cluster biogenesis protein NfuA